jgi:transposase-like protein
MACNGSMGKKTDPKVKERGLALLDKGNTIQQVAKRMGVSESLIRNWIRERPAKAPEEVQEPVILDNA